RLRSRLRADHVDGRRARPRPILGRQDDRELPHLRNTGRHGAMNLHPQARELLDAFNEPGRPPLATLTPDEARHPPVTFAQLIGPGPDVAVVRDIEIPGPAGR